MSKQNKITKQTSFTPVDSSKKLAQTEEEILKFWEENDIFEKSVKNRKTDDDSNEYSFYDGPPFATGLPHYGHIVGTILKDVIPRYWTMKGKYIPRKWGWDCHGLPIENIVEKELGSKTKKEIEELGVDKFNELCRSKVLEYADEWEKIIPRLGRWADMKKPYRTMDKSFMESVWWVFKQLWDKDLIYYSYRSMHICPRCETTLSQSEVSEGYKDVKDLSVIAEFELEQSPISDTSSPRKAEGDVGSSLEKTSTTSAAIQRAERSNERSDSTSAAIQRAQRFNEAEPIQQGEAAPTYVLAWTTTPWTLPGNVALAVGEDIEYVKIEKKDEGVGEKVRFILAKELLKKTFGEAKNKKVFLISGKYAFASRKYFPELKKQLEKNNYNVTIVDHINPDNPNLKENVQALAKYDLTDAHIITHSLGTSTLLQYLTDTKTKLSSLLMIAPPYPGKTLVSTDKKWEEESGYNTAKINPEKIISQITSQPVILYSDDGLIGEEDFKKLGVDLGAEIIREENKKHYFEPEINNAPDFDVLSYLDDLANYKIIEELKGSALVGLKYKPLWGTYAGDEKLENKNNGWKIYGADFVTTEEGTGVVHIAPAFGEDDMNLGKEKDLPFVQHVRMDGTVKEEVEAIGGLNVKPIDSPQSTDVEVIKYLAGKGLLFHKEKYEHSYPHCWRCDTPLINYATGSWFVAVTKIKENLLKNAKKINWTPKHIKEGRWGKWLEGGRDWSISRQRFWASVMPIWVCDKCGERKVFGSVADLEKVSGEKVDDLHKHIVDKITFSCDKCEGIMKRVPDVLDTWFDSGSMPYGQDHYPFENKEQFEKTFPADFIAEGIDQTRAWFYYLHVIAGGIFGSQAFKNVIVNGIVLAEDGQKMAKKLQNYPDPMEMVNKYGADPLRFYLAQSPIVNAGDLNFSEKDLAEVARGTFRMLWQSYSFFVMYANIDGFKPDAKTQTLHPKSLLDRWLISEVHQLTKDVNKEMENYRLMQAIRKFVPFIDNLSNWYVRRSRKRFWKSENDDDKKEAYITLRYALIELSKLLAPFTPFIAEEIYKNLSGEESVHLVDYPVADDSLIDEKINKSMAEAREIIKIGLQLRAQKQIKVRQPLTKLIILSTQIDAELIEIIKEELNVEFVLVDSRTQANTKDNIVWDENNQIGLDIEITPELKMEGQAREIIRAIQQMRKEADYQLDDRIDIFYQGGLQDVFEEFKELISKETLANRLLFEKSASCDLEKEIKIDDKSIILRIKK